VRTIKGGVSDVVYEGGKSVLLVMHDCGITLRGANQDQGAPMGTEEHISSGAAHLCRAVPKGDGGKESGIK